MYRKALKKFDGWCRLHRRALALPADVDAAAAEFMCTLSSAESAHLLAALIKAFPPLKGRLYWTAARVRDLATRHETFHHPPMSWELALGIASAMRRLGRPRDGLALLLQWRLGFRPGEVLTLCADDIDLPDDDRIMGIVKVGARYGSKSRRIQFTRVHVGDFATRFLLRRVLRMAMGSSPVAQSKRTTQFTFWIRRACGLMKVEPRWSAHCPRAGWATARWRAGQDWPGLREDGRWHTDTSLRVYIDAIAAASIERRPDVQAIQPWLDSLSVSFMWDWYL